MTRHHGGILAAGSFVPFAGIERRAVKIATGLERLGVGPGTSVAILMRNEATFLEASYAVMHLGAYAVPINWHFKGEEVASILADCEARALIGHADLIAAVAADLPAGLPVFAVPPPQAVKAAFGVEAPAALPEGVRDFTAWWADLPEHPGPARPAPMSMIYTSGTTGAPKGVRRAALDAAGTRVLDAMRAEVYGLRKGIRALLPGPLYHSAPNGFGLKAGRIADLLVLMPRFDAEELLAIIEAEAIDTILMVPTMFLRLLRLPEAVRRRYDVSSLRHVVHAAAPCPAEVKAAMLAWFGPVVYEFYGGTETGPVSFARPQDAVLKPGTVGRAAPGVEIRILDAADRILGPGEIGEVYARVSVYPDFTYNRQEALRAAIERDGFITCGDVGYLDADGYLFLCDRRRDMVISGGVNIYPAEIEAVLQALEGVHDCAVFGIPDAEYGEAVHAVVEPLAGVVLTPEAIRAHVAAHLANYKVPRTVEIRGDLPREDSGKIFKRRLRDAWWAGTGRQI